MKSKKLGVLVILILFIGMATVQINAKALNNSIDNNDPGPDVCCSGSIILDNVEPGEVFRDYFFIKNCGSKGSYLDWECKEEASWGIWTFNPESGIGLAIDEWISVGVTIEVPDIPGNTFTGEIKVMNSHNHDDFCTVDVTVITSRIRHLPFYHFLEKLKGIYPILFLILGRY